MDHTSKRNKLTINRFSFSGLLGKEVIEIIIAVGMFFLGPILLCYRFSDWVWISMIGLGYLLFIDAILGLIGGKNKLSVFKFICFIFCSLAVAALLTIQYVIVLLVLFPPI